jgi:LysR family transcriptional activator of nhaA
MHWFESSGVHPHVVGEFDDSALLKSFGQAGSGFFAAPTAISASVMKQYGVKPVGRIESVKEQLYAITTERRHKHPAIIAVINTTQQEVFAAKGTGG